MDKKQTRAHLYMYICIERDPERISCFRFAAPDINPNRSQQGGAWKYGTLNPFFLFSNYPTCNTRICIYIYVHVYIYIHINTCVHMHLCPYWRYHDSGADIMRVALETNQATSGPQTSAHRTPSGGGPSCRSGDFDWAPVKGFYTKLGWKSGAFGQSQDSGLQS